MRNLIFFSAIVLIAAACNSRANQQGTLKKDDSIPVRVAPIVPGDGNHVLNVSGKLSTEDEARLSFKVGGVIDRIFVNEGQHISKGQLLATIKPAEISAQVQQVQLALEKAKRDYQRTYNLYKDSVATLEQLQNAKTGMDIAQQNMQQAGFNQQYSKIHSLSDGFVVKKLKNEGELSEPGQAVLMVSSISASSNWVLNAGLSDKEWAMVRVGDKAEVSFDAFPGKKFPAVVSKKSLAADQQSGVFETGLQVSFGNISPAIGMFGNATIQVKQSDTGYSIPYEALLEANGKTGYVFVTNDLRTVKRVAVEIGDINQQVVYINAGLQEYKNVVISGSPYLNEESSIVIIP